MFCCSYRRVCRNCRHEKVQSNELSLQIGFTVVTVASVASVGTKKVPPKKSPKTELFSEGERLLMRKRIYILGSLIDKVDTKEALQRIEQFIQEGTPHQIITANAEIIYRGYQDKKLSRTLNKAHLVTADGAGVVWATRYLNDPVQERVTGIDLLHAICKNPKKRVGSSIF